MDESGDGIGGGAEQHWTGPAGHRPTHAWTPDGGTGASTGSFEGTERFEVLGELGRGGMGVVYEVLDRDSGRRMALKTLQQQDGRWLGRLKTEFRASSGMVHPNLIHLGELFVGEDGWFFTMELVEGRELRRAVRGRPALPAYDPLPARRLEALQRYAAQLAGAIQALHGNGKLHLDLKPENVLVERSDRLVLIDLGLSRPRDGSIDPLGAHRGGTVAYMAPEQLQSASVGPAADWYGFGSTLFELLVGDVAFLGPSTDITAAKRRGDRPPAVRELCPWAPRDLADLIDSLLDPDPARRPTAPEILEILHLPAAPPLPREAAPFSGRTEELAQLDRALHEARRGGPLVMDLRGESGIGKSALLDAFSRAAADGGALVFSGRCRTREWVPFPAFDGLVDDVVLTITRLRPPRRGALVPSAVRALVRLFPAFERVPEFADASADAAGQSVHTLDDASLRRDGFEALQQVIETLGGPRAVVLVLDDVQWADRDSAALLRFLLDRPGPRAWLVVLASRPGTHLPPLDLGPEVTRRDLRLGPLDPEACRAILDAGGAEPRESLDGLVAQSEGSPLWCRALAAAGREGGDAIGGVDELFQRSIGALPPEARDLLTRLALLGHPAPRTLVHAVAAGGAVDRWTDLLVAEGLLTMCPVGSEQGVEPAHQRVAAAAKATCVDPAALHREIAETLIAVGAPMDEIAEHLLAAGDTARGARYAYSAAEIARRGLEFGRAAHLLSLAIDLESAPQRRQRLQEQLGEVLACDARAEAAGRAYLAAAEEATEEARERLRYLGAEQLMRSGRIEEGRRLLDALLTADGYRIPKTEGGALASLLWHRTRLLWRGSRFVPTPAEALPTSVLARADAAWSAAVTLALVDAVTAASLQVQALLKALDLGEPSRIGRGLGAEAAFCAVFGDDAGAARRLEENRAAVAELGLPVDGAGLALAGAVAAYQRGDWSVCHQGAGEALSLLVGQRSNLSWVRATAVIYRLAAAAHLGRLDELLRKLPRELDGARDRGDLHALLHLSLGMPIPIHALLDRVEDGIEHAERAWTETPGQAYQQLRVHYLRTLVELKLYGGDFEDAARLAAEAWDLVRKTATRRVRIIRSGVVELGLRAALGIVSREPADPRRRRNAERWHRRLERCPDAWTTAVAGLGGAQLLAATGTSSTALAAFDEAARALDSVGMPLYAAAARYRRGELLDGVAGREDRRAALAWLARQGVVAPERVVRMIAPLSAGGQQTREGS